MSLEFRSSIDCSQPRCMLIWINNKIPDDLRINHDAKIKISVSMKKKNKLYTRWKGINLAGTRAKTFEANTSVHEKNLVCWSKNFLQRYDHHSRCPLGYFCFECDCEIDLESGDKWVRQTSTCTMASPQGWHLLLNTSTVGHPYGYAVQIQSDIRWLDI